MRSIKDTKKLPYLRQLFVFVAQTTHTEVLESAEVIGPKIIAILKDVLPRL